MSFELGNSAREMAMIAPRGIEEDGDGLGLSFKSIGKALKKVTKPVVKTVGKVAGVASVVGIPGAGLVNRAVNTGVGKKVTAVTKKVEAVKKATKPPPKPPPIVAPPPKRKAVPTSPSAGIAKKDSGAFASWRPGKPAPLGYKVVGKGTRSEKLVSLFADVTGGSSSTATRPSFIPKPAKPTKFNEQSKKAGLTYKKRRKPDGGTEVVGVDPAGAVVTKPIPEAVLVANQTPVVNEVLPANAVQATVAPVAAPAQADWASSSGGGGGGGSNGMTIPGTGPVGPAPEVAATGDGTIFGMSPLVVGAGLIGAVLILRGR